MTRTFLIAVFALAAVAAGQAADTPNTLTDQEKATGWKLLFDGTTTSGWRGYNKSAAPDGWKVEDGALALAGQKVGDLVTVDEYENFEFAFEWKISKNGNSGVFYLVQEKPELKNTYNSGPEYQVLDNAGHPDAKNGFDRYAGANYALQAPIKDASKPVGEWNQGRIVKNGAHVEHWLNGEKVVEYELWSDAWKAQVAKSKFVTMAAYGQAKKGRLALQDHGNPVWFRSLKVKVLPETKGTHCRLKCRRGFSPAFPATTH
jgi:3-keto-disaccharide hydrolase